MADKNRAAQPADYWTGRFSPASLHNAGGGMASYRRCTQCGGHAMEGALSAHARWCDREQALIRAHAAAQAQRFAVDIVHPDGSAEHLVREGGSSIDAANDAMERAGLGGVVRVRPLDCGAAA